MVFELKVYLSSLKNCVFKLLILRIAFCPLMLIQNINRHLIVNLDMSPKLSKTDTYLNII